MVTHLETPTTSTQEIVENLGDDSENLYGYIKAGFGWYPFVNIFLNWSWLYGKESRFDTYSPTVDRQ